MRQLIVQSCIFSRPRHVVPAVVRLFPTVDLMLLWAGIRALRPTSNIAAVDAVTAGRLTTPDPHPATAAGMIDRRLVLFTFYFSRLRIMDPTEKRTRNEIASNASKSLQYRRDVHISRIGIQSMDWSECPVIIPHDYKRFVVNRNAAVVAVKKYPR